MPPTPEEIAAAQADADAEANGDDDSDNDDSDDVNVDSTDSERLLAALRAARKAERQTKRQLSATAKERDSLKTAQMSEAERIQMERDEAIAERDALKAQARDRAARDAVEAEARKQNAIRPDVVSRLVSLEFDDDGNPTNVRTEVNQLKKDYPEMFGAAGSADGGSGRGASPRGVSMSDQIRRSMGRG